MKNWCVYLLHPCYASSPVKPKFIICISKEKSRFYFINSCEDEYGISNGRPYESEKELCYFIPKNRLSCIVRGSYINLQRLENVPKEILRKSDIIIEKDPIPNDILIAIKAKVRNFDIDKPRCRLSQEIKDIIENYKRDRTKRYFNYIILPAI